MTGYLVAGCVYPTARQTAICRLYDVTTVFGDRLFILLLPPYFDILITCKTNNKGA